MLKTVSSITNAIGALNFKGTWNASTNTPTIVSGVGVKGDYFVVSVAGSTTIDGISNWGIGDWIAYNGAVWQRVEGGADLNGVNLSVSGTTTLSGLTASTALALNASKEVVSVVAPAFSVFNSANQTPPSGVVTKVLFDSETFDTNNNFASSRFTPTVAGYYQLNASANIGGSTDLTAYFISLHKNGAEYKRGIQGNIFATAIANVAGCNVSDVVFLNGTTDFVEVFALVTTSTPFIIGGSVSTWFSGCFLRGA